MSLKNIEAWCEVECAKYIHSRLETPLRERIYPETILVLLYKKHEYEVFKINVAQNEDPSFPKKSITMEENLFPSQLEFLNKLGLNLGVEFLFKIIELEQE